MQMVRFSCFAARRRRSMFCACSSCVPWEKFSRATSIPRRMRSRSIGSELQAGPTVQMILARRMVEAEGDPSVATPARVGKDFPFFNFVPIRSLCRSNYCIWRVSLLADATGARRRGPSHKRSQLHRSRPRPRSSTQQMPGLLIRCVLAGGVVGMETNPTLFPMNYKFRWDDVPNVFCDDIGGQEVEFSSPIGPAGTGLRPTYVATWRGSVDCGLNLHADEVAGSSDHHVVARKVSPGFGNPET